MIEEPDSVARARMVSDQIRARGVDDPRVIDAMLRVPRHLFVGPEQRPAAYADHPIAIGFGQTISQPYIVGFMLAALKLEPTHRVLEIGTGSGYQTALLAELVESVYSLDVVQELADGARRLLDSLGYRNVIVAGGGWTRGLARARALTIASWVRRRPKAFHRHWWNSSWMEASSRCQLACRIRSWSSHAGTTIAWRRWRRCRSGSSRW